ncbi:MAG: glycosyltransferase family 1 protein, partial [Flavobacterium sp.]
MRILLIGEYSRLHNSLKEGLVALGHEVILLSDGDGFKNYPSDMSIKPTFLNNKLLNIPRQAIFRITGFDILKMERALRFYFLIKKLKGFDVVQLINEAPIQTVKKIEGHLLTKIFKQNKKVFLLSCGADFISVKFMLDRKPRYSVLNPYFDNPES